MVKSLGVGIKLSTNSGGDIRASPFRPGSHVPSVSECTSKTKRVVESGSCGSDLLCLHPT